VRTNHRSSSSDTDWTTTRRDHYTSQKYGGHHLSTRHIVLRAQHRLESNHFAIEEADLMGQYWARHVAMLNGDSITGIVSVHDLLYPVLFDQC
jgi:hypothetical protein